MNRKKSNASFVSIYPKYSTFNVSRIITCSATIQPRKYTFRVPTSSNKFR